jgi:hypothetical protein
LVRQKAPGDWSACIEAAGSFIRIQIEKRARDPRQAALSFEFKP